MRKVKTRRDKVFKLKIVETLDAGQGCQARTQIPSLPMTATILDETLKEARQCYLPRFFDCLSGAVRTRSWSQVAIRVGPDRRSPFHTARPSNWTTSY